MRRALLLVFVAWAGASAPCLAQESEPPPGNWFTNHVRLSGEASASYSTKEPQAEGWFNYSDYETSTVRALRVSLVGEVTLSSRVAVLTEIRTLQLEAPEAYALYVRVRPWLSQDLDIHLGRIPPTFGAFPRRLYVTDNPLIGMPLGYQYLTSARADAVPATTDELVRMRGRGWLASYSVGNTTPEAGLPIANALRWDTGAQVRWQRQAFTTYAAVTQGTLGDPRLSDDNGGAQLAARVVYTPHPVVVLGASAARGPYLAQSLEPHLPGTSLRSYHQRALGVDTEVSRDRWILRGEVVWNRWDQPAYQGDPRRGLDSRASMVEARYRLTPALYVAGRAEHLGFSTVTTSARTLVTWDAPVRRLELGAGWTVQRHVLLKGVWQRNRRDGGRVRASDLGALQVVTWF